MHRLAAAGHAIDALLKGRPELSGLRSDEQLALRELLSDALVNAPGRPVSIIIQVARLDEVMTADEVRFLPETIYRIASGMWSSEPE